MNQETEMYETMRKDIFDLQEKARKYDELKEKIEWMITQYEHEVELIKQDLEDKSLNRMVLGTKLVVYDRVLHDLDAEDWKDD